MSREDLADRDTVSTRDLLLAAQGRIVQLRRELAEAKRDAERWRALLNLERVFIGRWATKEEEADGEGAWKLIGIEDIDAAMQEPRDA